MATETLRLEYPGLPPVEYSANSRAYWTTRRGKHGANNEVLETMKWLLAESGWQGEPMEHAMVTMFFELPTRHRRDHDSLVQRAKPLWDALVRLGVLKDDDLKTIGFPIYGYKYARDKVGKTIVEIIPGP